MNLQRHQSYKDNISLPRYITYGIDGTTFSFESIERVGPLYIANYADRDEMQVHFTIYFKSGGKFTIHSSLLTTPPSSARYSIYLLSPGSTL